MASSEFREALDRLGLAQYHDGLVQEAFDSWEVLPDITEEDLDALGVKLGHRRILQRAIADYRQNEPQSMPAIDQSSAPKHKTTKSNGSVGIPDHQTEASGPPRVQTGGKRKYRRHPKPDDNAPDRPPSAYVLFSNQVRESLKGQEYSFTEIAKTVGEKWQVLPPDEKGGFESRSQAMKDHYYTQLAEYKKTQDYADYQRYLVDFKAKHEPRTGKRVKEDSPASPGRRDSGDRFMSSPDTRDSSNNGSEYSRGEKRRSGFGSPRMLGRGDWRPAMPQESSTESSSSRLTMEPHHSPLPAKPTFASINGSQPHNTSHLNSHRHMSQSATPMGDHPMAVSTSIAYGFHPMLTTNGSDSPVPSLASRRSTLASEHSLPSLRHSESLSSGNSAGSPLSTSNGSLPPFNRALPSRELPPPFLTKTSPGTPSLPPIKAPGSPGIYSPQVSGLATLLRAGEHLASNGSRDDARPEIHDPESRA